MLDLKDGQVLGVVETGPDSYSEGSLIVDTRRNRLYAANPGDATCSVLDALTLEPVITLNEVEQLALDLDGGRLYVVGPTDRRALDAESYEILHQAPMPPGWQSLHLVVDPFADRLYLAGRDAGGYLLGLYEASTLDPISTTPLPGKPDALLAAPGWQQLFVTLDDGQDSSLWIMDGEGRVMQKRAMGGWTQTVHLALDREGARLFLGRESYGDHGVTILDLETGEQVGDIDLTPGPKALAWDGKSGRLFLSDTYEGRIYAVGVEGGQVAGFFPTAIELEDVGVDPARGQVYVTDTAGQLHILDSDSGEELAVLPGEGRIALDSRHGRLYTGGKGADRVRIFSLEPLLQTGEIQTRAMPVADSYHGGLYLVQSGIYLASHETMTITGVISDTLPQHPGFSPNPSAVDAVVDPGSGRIFAIINNGVPGSNGGTYLYVYEPGTYERVLADTERSPIYLDVDPASGQAYVSRAHMTSRSTSLLVGGREYHARMDSVFGALRVDPELGRVFLTVSKDPPGTMFVLNSENLEVMGAIPVTGTLLALDPQRHLLYLATGQGRMEVWSAVGGELPTPEPPVATSLASDEFYERYQVPGSDSLFARDKDYRLYHSADGGESWVRLRGGLPDEWVVDLALSPSYDQDQTLFAAVTTADQGYGIWMSTDGGRSWFLASRGLTDMSVTHLAPSPDYVNDRVLFAIARKGGLYRSTDAGETWIPLTVRYRPPDAYDRDPGSLVFSPAYAQDQTLFMNHYGLQRSADGGETWTRVLPHTLEVQVFAPDFATDHRLFGWTSNGGLLRSTDAGATWTAASAGLSLSSYGSGRVMVSPDFGSSQILYFIWTESLAGVPERLYRSTDAAKTWQRLVGEPPQGAIPVELADDGSAFVAEDSTGQEVRWPMTDLEWQSDPLSLAEVSIRRLTLSPDFGQGQTLYVSSPGSGILRVADTPQDPGAGLDWTDTGFPFRVAYNDPPELVIVTPGTLFAGTTFGLYRSVDGGPWTLAGGGLPQGGAISSPSTGADGSLRVLAGGAEVYLSTDGGQTWTQAIPNLPYRGDVDSLSLSPTFATDRTAFLAMRWKRPLRTSGGSEWEEVGPPGKWTLSSLQASPTFDQDGLLFLSLEGGELWRSEDGGDSWMAANGPWHEESPLDLTLPPGYTHSSVTFSAAYAQDGVILTRAGDAVYRTTDKGDTWTPVLDLDPPPAQLFFTPDYMHDGELYLLQGRTLYCSSDRGQRWEILPWAPWSEQDRIHLEPSPSFSRDRTVLAWMPAGVVYQSVDGGQSWRDASSGLPGQGVRQVLFSPNYATDGLVYLVPTTGQGLYRRVGESPWMPADKSMPPPTPVPTVPPTPTTVSCTAEPDIFHAVWQQAQARLGCLVEPALQVTMAEQTFEQGRMIWDSRDLQIYVLLAAGAWQAFDDTFAEGTDPSYDPDLPPPPKQPQRGFGKVWREELGGPEAAIGWALEVERPVSGWRQRFEKGLLVWTESRMEGADSGGTAYLLFDDGKWLATPAPAP
jgi:photosystem II stability/assembly factor-like uncharacterized protein/DNA-binding beta-propeller fold protein YncE